MELVDPGVQVSNDNIKSFSWACTSTFDMGWLGLEVDRDAGDRAANCIHERARVVRPDMSTPVWFPGATKDESVDISSSSEGG
jgi:hypothetical protein